MAVFQKNGWWWIDYYYTVESSDPATGEKSMIQRRTRRKISKQKKQAEEELNKVLYMIQTGQYLKDEKHFLLSEGVRWYMETFVKPKAKDSKQLHNYERPLYEFIKTTGDKDMESITVRDIENFKMARLSRGISKSSIDRDLGTISGLFTQAFKLEMITRNNLAGKMPFYGDKVVRERVATPDEIRLILSSIKNKQYKMVILIAILTGLRLKDIVNLDMTKINMKEGFIDLKPGKTLHKTGKKAIIAIHPVLYDKLKEYIHENGVTGRLFDVKSQSLTNLWCELMPALEIEDLQFRDLRHTFASSLDADIKSVMDILGHTRPEQSMDYQKTNRDRIKRGINGIEADYLKDLI